MISYKHQACVLHGAYQLPMRIAISIETLPETGRDGIPEPQIFSNGLNENVIIYIEKKGH